ncbi:AtpZ/AtpI family protein [Candidatus Saccharibacteria bacterium]|nr:AtpZ/AtpI family protein [Candidatus Saccharibacteria bacterium]
MVKSQRPKTRRKTAYVDPAISEIDKLAVLDARNMLITNMLGMGLRLAFTVLVPIFVGIQLDKWLDSSPSATLAAFMVAIYMSSVMIYRNYVSMVNESTRQESKKQALLAKKAKKSSQGRKARNSATGSLEALDKKEETT